MVTRSTRKVMVHRPEGCGVETGDDVLEKKPAHSRSAPSERPMVKGISAIQPSLTQPSGTGRSGEKERESLTRRCASFPNGVRPKFPISVRAAANR